MTSYQRLKEKCDRLQAQVDMFKSALTIAKTPLKTCVDKQGHMCLSQSYQIIENTIDREAQVKLTHWVIKNIDRKIIKEWLKKKPNTTVEFSVGGRK